MEPIEIFLDGYDREFDFYSGLARITAQTCETLLSDEGIRHLVTWRAKRSDRLREKIVERHKKCDYQSSKQIRDDIVDLAGVRIALFFPTDRPRVEAILNSHFLVSDQEGCKRFPETGKDRRYSDQREFKFSGYHATHFRLRHKTGTLNGSDARFVEAAVEVQIGSVLMMGWQEVEHDLVYKPLSGPISDEELEIIDEVNGLVLAGEIALGRLNEATRRRLTVQTEPFSNQYELATFILKNAGSSNESRLGRIDLLFEFLRLAELMTPNGLEGYLDGISEGSKSEPISALIIGGILRKHPEYADFEKLAWQTLEGTKAAPNEEKPTEKGSYDLELGRFLDAWIQLEKFAYDVATDAAMGQNDSINEQRSRTGFPFRILRDKNLLSEHELEGVHALRIIRNEIVHGRVRATAHELSIATRTINNLISSMTDNATRSS